MKFLILLALAGCTASDDLESAVIQKHACENFQTQYNAAALSKPPTDRVVNKIKECKDLGAWK